MYECGHEPRKIFLKKTDVVWYHLYNQWKKSDSKLCFDCWNKKRKKDFLGKCKKVVEVTDLLLDLESMLQAETYSELKQCVSDYIDELKEK